MSGSTVNPNVIGEKRELCWKMRDIFHNCLDNNGDDQTMCEKEYSDYQNHCPKSWIKHFESRRKYERARR